VVTQLERRYAAFDGLNLTWETLEGIAKHNGPLTDRTGRPIGRYALRGVPLPIRAYNALHDLQLWSHASAEAQAAAIADDIAYDAHDIDDGLRAELFEIADLAELELISDILREIHREHPSIDPARRAHELIRRLITRMIEDVVGEARRRLAALSPRSADDVREAGRPTITFSPAFAKADRAIKDFLYPRMYRHPRIVRILEAAQGILRALFFHFMQRPQDMPPDWAQGLSAGDEEVRARRVADFIAGMTDRYALIEHAKHFDSTPELR
jgi:dGTPase